MNNVNYVFDVIEQILIYDDKKILIIFDEHGKPWFKLKDLLIMFDYKSYTVKPQKIKISDKNKKKYSLLSTKYYSKKQKIIHNTIFVNESGAYELLNTSTKQIAIDFRDNIFNNILPTLRETGEYIISGDEKKKLKMINAKLENMLELYKQELNYYYDKYDFLPSKTGYLYINEVKLIHHGKKITGYKPGYCSDMKTRKFVYKTGNFYYKLLCYIPINIDKNTLEACYLSVLKEHKYKKNTKNEILFYLSLEELKNSMKNCIVSLGTHICECVYCKKCYKVSSISKHECEKKLIGTEFIDMNIDKLLNKTKNNDDSYIDAKTITK